MKINVKKGEFLTVLQKLQGVVEKRNTMPILSNILIEAAKNKLEVTATDLEVSFRDVCPSDVKKEGSITINARKLLDIVREMPEDDIEVEVKEGGRISIKSGKSRFNVNSLPVSEFPAFPVYNESSLVVVMHNAIKDMIEKTLRSISLDETRQNINGMFFESSSGKIRMVATDGYRLSLDEKDMDTQIELKKGVIIPRKGILELKKLLETEGSLMVGFTENSCVFKKGSAVLVTRLIDGEFPDYRQVIPTTSDKHITADREKLTSSLTRMTLLSSEKIKGVKFSISKGKMEMYSSNPDFGDAVEEIDVNYKGEPIEVSFNATYLLDAINVNNNKVVVIELKDSTTAGVIKIPGEEGYLSVIMPMRI